MSIYKVYDDEYEFQLNADYSEDIFNLQGKSLSLQTFPVSKEEDDDDEDLCFKNKTRSKTFILPKSFVPKPKPKQSDRNPSPMTLNLVNNSYKKKGLNNFRKYRQNDLTLSFEEEYSSTEWDSDSIKEFDLSQTQTQESSLSMKHERREMGKIKTKVSYFKEFEDINQSILENIWMTFNFSPKEDFYFQTLEDFRKKTIEIEQRYSILFFLEKYSKEGI